MWLTGIPWYTQQYISYIICCLKLALYTHKQCETGNFFSTGKEAKDKQCDNPELTSWACCALKYK